jgi:hypothetical protein
VPYRDDLEIVAAYKRFFDFGIYRRPEYYGLIVEHKEVGEPV